MLIIDAEAGVLDIELDEQTWQSRPVAQPEHQAENEVGFGRELFGVFRAAAALLNGASVFWCTWLAKSHKGRFKTKELQSNEQD
ncbi:hypothetical protein [Acinetobacter baumannii]|uniref:hypothetical protein n=1 Tax=Acinetobacter baumannii TaxID=470 RepID=UPI0036F4800F